MANIRHFGVGEAYLITVRDCENKAFFKYIYICDAENIDTVYKDVEKQLEYYNDNMDERDTLYYVSSVEHMFDENSGEQIMWISSKDKVDSIFNRIKS